MAWAITAAVVMGGLTANSISEQNKAAQKQQEAVASQVAMNYKMKEAQEQELKAKAGLELAQEAIQANTERGKIRAAAAESGVAGASTLRNLSNTYLQQSLTNGSIISGEESALRGVGYENINSYMEGLSNVNKLEANKTTGLEAALQVGMSAAGGYMGAGGTFGGSAATGTFTNAATGATTVVDPSMSAAMMPGMTSAGYTYSASPAYAGFGTKEMGFTLLSSSYGKRK